MNSLSAKESSVLSFLRQYLGTFGRMPQRETVIEAMQGADTEAVSMQIASLIAKGNLRLDEQGAFRLPEKEELILLHCRSHYPNGRLQGNYWICGPNPRTCLYFILSGDNTGFHDPVSGKSAVLGEDLEWSQVEVTSVTPIGNLREAA